MNKLLASVTIFSVFIFIQCISTSKTQKSSTSSSIDSSKGLKDYYNKYFTIGVAVSLQALKTDEAGLILQQFGSMTPENPMKLLLQ